MTITELRKINQNLQPGYALRLGQNDQPYLTFNGDKASVHDFREYGSPTTLFERRQAMLQAAAKRAGVQLDIDAID